MGRVLIVGYGNPLRGDDGLGWHAAQRLSAVVNHEDVSIHVCHQLTPEMAEMLSSVDLAVFIDAACEGIPGALSRQTLSEDETAAAAFTHTLDIPALLACAQTLYGLCPRTVLFSVAAESFDFGESLSAPVDAALPELVAQVQALVEGAVS